jgi:predicted dehydrogenase
MYNNKNTPFHWGIIGPGRIARKFADDLGSLPGARLYAVGSTSLERARAFAAEYDAPHAFGSYADLARCPGLDAVYVASPHTGHAEHTLLCLDAGVPVLCEKPLAINAAQARRMADAARANGVFLMEALWSRFIPGVERALELAREGAVGEIHTVKADFGFYLPFDPASRLFDPALGGGALLDIGLYPALLALSVLGKPDDVLAAASFAPSGVDRTCAFTFRYPEGRIALGHVTLAANTPVEAWLYGAEGAIYLYPRFHHTQKLRLTRYEGRSEQTEELDFPYEGWGYAFEAAHVMECLENGLKESPRVPLSLSLALVETLDKVREGIGLVYKEDRGNAIS